MNSRRPVGSVVIFGEIAEGTGTRERNRWIKNV